ncbi:MAG: hypothetical protein V3T30_05665 [Thermodesulfobacteriota bacterium]
MEPMEVIDRMKDAIDLTADGRYYKAKAIFEKDHEYKRYPDAMSAYALCLAAVDKDYECAKTLCLNALKHDLYNSEIYLNLGKIFLVGNNKALAIRAFRKGLGIDDTHVGLIKLACSLGIRRVPVLPFLSRRNAVNRVLGFVSYKLGFETFSLVRS